MPKYYIDFECWVAEAPTEAEALVKAEHALKLRHPAIVSSAEVVEDGDVEEFLGEEQKEGAKDGKEV